MTQHLLAAEADKIQDLIFRASRLREVIGGSQLLSRFCDEVPEKLLPEGAEIVVNDGGSFRVLFEGEDEAKRFGHQLAEVYRRATGGTLTVAEPAPMNDDFKEAAKEANQALRRAKRHREGFTATPHIPYVAFCASCGVGLAVEHSRRPGEVQGQYLCADCRAKRNESDLASATEPGDFLTDFFKQVVDNDWRTYHWPGKKKDEKEERDPDPPMDVARFDPRDYIAYIVADGNGMGRVFGECNQRQLCALSNNLKAKVYASLADSTRALIERAKEEKGRTQLSNFLPVLPLIAGGDDLFILLPAPWALDFAHRFAQAYEKEIGQLFEDQGIQDVDRPTVAVAVVICKAKYPYYLAHQRGEKLLKQAKQVTKRWATENNETPRSIVSFEVILGSRLGGIERTEAYRPTLGPYWVGGDVDGWGLDIKHLLEQRHALRALPRRRLAQLRAHFDVLTEVKDNEFKAWSKRLDQLLARFPNGQREIAEAALRDLGGRDLYCVERTTDRKDWCGHALPDLLDAWDFAFDLGCSRTDYEE
jgi:hypothetical protein